MRRMAFVALWFAGAIITLSEQPTVAPVPKHLQPAKPTKITGDLLKGRWHYEWSTMLGGWIEFDADGTYTAQHEPGSNTVYSGTYSIGENSITIVEWSHNTLTGTSSGPTCYRFDVDVKDWPTLPGKSTGGFGFDVQAIPEAHTHLKLRDRK